MKFSFIAKDQNGKTREGVVDAINRETAVQILQQNSLILVSVEREGASWDLVKAFHKYWEGVTQKELLIFFRQLATLVEARVPVVSSLRAIEEQTENRYFRVLIQEMADDIEDGMPFSESLAGRPDIFSPLIVNLIKSGEVSGNLHKVIGFVADNIEKNYQLTSKVKSALFYPAFVVSVAAIIGFLIISFILPKLTLLIRDLDVAIPWYTQAVMAVGDFMQHYWWAVLLIIIGFFGGLAYYVNSEAGRREWHAIQLKLPVFGTLFRSIYLSRFADNLSTLLEGGIPMIRSLLVVSKVVNNHIYEGIILKGAEEVKGGGSMSTVFSRYPEIPPIVTRMIKIGEETGKMDQVLKSTSNFYNQEVENMSRNMTTLIEPILIVILGIGVAILVFAVILPIYDIAGKL